MIRGGNLTAVFIGVRRSANSAVGVRRYRLYTLDCVYYRGGWRLELSARIGLRRNDELMRAAVYMRLRDGRTTMPQQQQQQPWWTRQSHPSARWVGWSTSDAIFRTNRGLRTNGRTTTSLFSLTGGTYGYRDPVRVLLLFYFIIFCLFVHIGP